MEALIERLQQHNIAYDIIHHDHPIRSAQDGADYFRIEIGQTAPALVLKSDEGYYGLIMSGNRGRIDFDSLSAILGSKSLKLANPKEVQQLTGYSVGSVALVLPLPCILDRRLFQYPHIYGGTGQLNATLKIAPQTLEQLNQVIAYWDAE